LKTYLVFEPADGDGGAAGADRVVFLREKFRWMALFFAPLWVLWHRLWLGFAGWLGAVTAIAITAFAFGLSPEAAAPLLWLPTLVVAFEGTELLRRKLLRAGYEETSVKVGHDLEDAERRFFAEWKPRPASRVRTATSPKPVPSAVMPVPAFPSSNVVGSFREPGARR
jgi:hypothetical protein